MSVPEGWYIDPQDATSLRWWDGNAWTEHRQPMTTTPQIGYARPIPGADKKIIAGIFGIVLGGLGIHRFYLGDTTGGILRLLITLVTCGIGNVIGLIEGIIYLTMSDEDFVQTYLIEQRAWF